MAGPHIRAGAHVRWINNQKTEAIDTQQAQQIGQVEVIVFLGSRWSFFMSKTDVWYGRFS